MAFLLKWLVQTHFTREIFDFQLNSNETHPFDYNGKTWVNFGVKKKPNKWVTLRALRVLKAAA